MADDVTATYSRAVGESVAGWPVPHHGDAGARRRRAEQLRDHERGRQFTINRRRDVDDESGEQDLWGPGPESADDRERQSFLVADNVTATYSRAVGESVAGRPVSHHGDAGPPRRRAGQLRDHERGRELHDQQAAGDVDDESGEQDLRGSGPESADDGERDASWRQTT